MTPDEIWAVISSEGLWTPPKGGKTPEATLGAMMRRHSKGFSGSQASKIPVFEPVGDGRYRLLPGAEHLVLEEDSPVSSPEGRRYWAGGHQFAEDSKVPEFLRDRCWYIGWPRDSDNKAAVAAWRRISEIQPDDLFAIKGYGGRNDLRVYAVGKVEEIDANEGRLQWSPVEVPLFHGKAPGAPGGGTWFETLCEVTNPAVHRAVYGVGQEDMSWLQLDEDCRVRVEEIGGVPSIVINSVGRGHRRGVGTGRVLRGLLEHDIPIAAIGYHPQKRDFQALAPLPEENLIRSDPERAARAVFTAAGRIPGGNQGSRLRILVGDGARREDLAGLLNVLSRGVGPVPHRIPSSSIPRNLILFGPPGTGKTYRMREMRKSFTLAAPTASSPPVDVADRTWFEVVALALNELGRPAEALEVIAHPLVQAKYVERAPQTRLGPFVWAQLQTHTVQESTTVRYEKRTRPLIFDKTADGRWFLPEGLPAELRAVSEEYSRASDTTPDNQFFVTFHPSFTYEDFLEGIRPESDEDGGPVRYPLRAGIFKQACERAVQLTGFQRGLADFCSLSQGERKELLADAPPAVLFIDEINRGNVARIFGELITLIEVDKRLGADHELMVTLPGSRQRFGVPSNLWIIGTMNTADRSVVALDVALRRRFAFEEQPPRPELLDTIEVEGVNLGSLLRSINRRLLVLRDRDHLIGHAFFLPLANAPTLEGLRRVFRESVLPLLLEYFHDDLGRVGLVLGPAWVRRTAGSDVFARGFEHDYRADLAERPVWEISDVNALPAEAFRDIDG
jgi:hypothetical protein